MCRNNIPLLLILVCLVIGVLAALTPFFDMDHDGLLDSLITDGFILIPALCSVTGLLLLLTRLPVACLAAPRLFSSLLLLPPILN
jgi:hypothetical protein